MHRLSIRIALLLSLTVVAWPAASAPEAGSPAALVGIADALAALRRPQPGEAGVVDHRAAAVAARKAALRRLQAEHAALDPAHWSRPDQVDWLALRGQLDEHDFLLHVQQPWARDPGFYTDQVLRPAFTTLPTPPEQAGALTDALRRVPALLAAARENLDPALVPGDFARLALFNLENADGVGHGHPYRAVPPAGILGWYDDLLDRARRQQPELVAEIEPARAAIAAFRDWLALQAPAMTAPAGFGETLFDWYLRHVKYMPYRAREIERLGQRGGAGLGGAGAGAPPQPRPARTRAGSGPRGL